MADKITIFIMRLQKVGVNIECSGNYPWIYITKINGKRVTELFQGNHGFTLAFLPVKQNDVIKFTDITEIFKLIRRYKNK